MVLLTSSILLDTFLLITSVIFIVYKYFTWDFDYWSKRNVKFIKPTPFIGNFGDVLATKKSIGGFLSDFYFKMPGLDYFGIWVFGTPHLVVRSPELIKHILVKDFNSFSDRTIASDKNADPIMAHVIFIMKNPLWKAVRAKLTPIFTTGKMKNMVPLIADAGAAMNKYLYKQSMMNDEVEMKEVTAKFTTDVITSCVFGVNAMSFEHEDAAFRSIGRRMFNFKLANAIRGTAYFFAPRIVSLFKLRFFEEGINEFCRDAFWDAINERRRTGAKRNDMVDIIIEMLKTNEFEGDEAVAQAVQFFAAGFETTSSTISFALYELALNENYQTKLRMEIKQMREDHSELDYEAIKDLKFLDQVVKETLRKYPVLPFLDRRCMENYVSPNKDLVIEKGTPVYIPIKALHYDEQYFKNPEVFDPERFTDENAAKIQPYSYLPFGTGPHNCIGERFGLMGSKIGIIEIISNFYLECSENTPQPIEFDPKSFILQPVGGLPLKCIPIHRKMSMAG